MSELKRVAAHLMATCSSSTASTDRTVAGGLSVGDAPTHPLHETAGKVNHLTTCPTDEAERVAPIPPLLVGLGGRVGPVLVEEDE